MSIGERLVGIVVLATSSVVFAQTIETKSPDVGSSGATNNQLSATPAPNPCQEPAQELSILTDTMGVDFGPYLARTTRVVRANWMNLIPPTAYPPISKQGKVSIEFLILKDGNVSGMQLHASSGDIELDRAAWASITASNPFPPLPGEFPGQRIGLRISFYYNATTAISISPCADVRVPAGSTLQFLASGKGITNASVTWSVSGSGCSKSSCGTISDTGLYTAPVNIPNPPAVIVKAASRTGINITGKSKVTVVQASPSH